MFIHHREIQQILLVLYFLLSYDGVRGEIKLSKLEELALDKQLKRLNKPAVKTIKTQWGDTFDCVDFYKQPAFDHPLLKNHNFHPKMKPTLPTIHQIPSTSTIDIFSRIRSENNSCPFGTVPIKRVTKEDLIRHRSLPPPENFTFKAQLDDDDTFTNPGPDGLYDRAIVQTPENPNNKFSGAGMVATVWSVNVQGQQNSACRLKIEKGSNKLQVGWRADPTLYGDSRTRLFIHMQIGDRQCFNTLCSHGFIIVNTSNYVDQVLEPVSQKGSQQYGITVFITRDLINGNWWLLIGTDQIAVGFWPARIFTELANDFATNVEWGGVAYTPPGATMAPMGTGFWPFMPDPTVDAYCRGLTIIDDKGDGAKPDTSRVLDNSFLYRLTEESNLVFYGGPEDPSGYV